MEYARFMSSFAGRMLRIVAGTALIFLGLAAVHGTGGIILAVIGVVPLVAGIGNYCLLAPLFGGPLSGKDIQLKAIPVKANRSRRY